MEQLAKAKNEKVKTTNLYFDSPTSILTTYINRLGNYRIGKFFKVAPEKKIVRRINRNRKKKSFWGLWLFFGAAAVTATTLAKALLARLPQLYAAVRLMVGRKGKKTWKCNCKKPSYNVGKRGLFLWLLWTWNGRGEIFLDCKKDIPPIGIMEERIKQAPPFSIPSFLPCSISWHEATFLPFFRHHQISSADSTEDRRQKKDGRRKGKSWEKGYGNINPTKH